jgi:glycosyltransferase involved in cell wall biosynthesis
MRIAYIISRFPLLSETFILREMIEIEKLGHELVVYPIICQDQPVIHDEARGWLTRVKCIPFLSSEVIAENIRVFFNKPVLYLHLLWRIFFENLSSMDFLIKDLYLFPKAVYTSRQLIEEKIDHIHAHYATHPGFEAWVIHQLTGIRYSITIHSHDIYDCHAMLKTKLEGAEFLAPISNFNIDYMANLIGEHIRKKCTVVRCGVDDKHYIPISTKPDEQNGKFEILQVGSLHWKKGQLYLIQAMSLLKERNFSFRLRIIGEGKERLNIEAEIKRLNVGDVVELMGSKTQAEVAQLLPTADCYVQSSVSEGIPVAIMEAMACELPVIATQITGIPELVIQDKTGYLVPLADPTALAEAIITVKENPEKAKQLGKNGREWVLQEFNLNKNAIKLAGLFEKLKPSTTAE